MLIWRIIFVRIAPASRYPVNEKEKNECFIIHLYIIQCMQFQLEFEGTKILLKEC